MLNNWHLFNRTHDFSASLHPACGRKYFQKKKKNKLKSLICARIFLASNFSRVLAVKVTGVLIKNDDERSVARIGQDAAAAAAAVPSSSLAVVLVMVALEMVVGFRSVCVDGGTRRRRRRRAPRWRWCSVAQNIQMNEQNIFTARHTRLHRLANVSIVGWCYVGFAFGSVAWQMMRSVHL